MSMRQIHRWLSAAFVVTAIANIFIAKLTFLPAWIIYAPLLPLALLLITGLYLFVQPNAVRWRRAQFIGGVA